jgi:hypothetical protein
MLSPFVAIADPATARIAADAKTFLIILTSYKIYLHIFNTKNIKLSNTNLIGFFVNIKIFEYFNEKRSILMCEKFNKNMRFFAGCKMTE